MVLPRLGGEPAEGIVSGFRTIRRKARLGGRDEGVAAELRAAKELRESGFNVHFQAEGEDRVADFLVGGAPGTGIGGIAMDVYSPTTANPDRLISAIAKKSAQAQGVVLDLSRTSVTVDDLGDVLTRVQNAGADNIERIIIVGLE